jgi:sn-glycerol 3-phosphate transport system ATP-binding protein
VRGTIATREMLGSETIYQVKTDRHAFMVKCIEDRFTVDQDVYLGVDADKMYFFGPDENRIREDDSRFSECMRALRGMADG